MINIINMHEFATKTKYTIGFDMQEFPIEELEYRIEENDGKTFLLFRGKLIEIEVLK